jgi:transposase-like protein
MAARAEPDRDALRELFERFTTDPSWIPTVSSEITDAIHAELAELDSDDDIRLATFVSTESVLRLMTDMVALGQPASEAVPPPAAVEYVRDYVRRGVSIDTLLRAYHVGHATFFRSWVERAHAELTDGTEIARAVELGATWTFEYIQVLNRGIVTLHALERERWVRSATAMRTETIRSLLAGEPVDERKAARRLRYDLDRHHLAFLVWSDNPSAAGEDLGALELVALGVSHSLAGTPPLLVPFGRQLVAAWIGAHERIGPVAATAVPIDRTASALVAVGTPGHGLGGFCRSHREATHARRVAQLAARRARTVTRYEDVALTALASADLQHARDYVAAELGPLARQDDDTLRLAATLRVYLEERASPRRAAQRLGVHENTITNRVRAITELMGRPPEDRVAELLVALRLTRVTQ